MTREDFNVLEKKDIVSECENSRLNEERVLTYGMVGTNRGGIETYLKRMSEKMSPETIFDYVIEGAECVHEQEIKARGGKVYYITKRRKNPLKNLKDNYILLRDLREEVATVYFNLSSLSWIFPIYMARCFHYRVFVHAHNASFVKENAGIAYRIINFLNKKILSKSDVERLSCSRLATEFMFEKKDKVEMIYNAIDVSRYQFSFDVRQRIRKEMCISNKFVLGFVGRLEEQKNPLMLVNILDAVHSINKDTVLIIAGDGSMRMQILEQIKKKQLGDACFVLGNISNVNEIMQAFDVLILPSRSEGLPYVVVEAQAAGLPCMISEHVTKEVDATGNVRYLPIESASSIWADNILEFMDQNTEMRVRFASIMKNSSFNIDYEARRLESILRGLSK